LVSWVGAFNGWNVSATPMTKSADGVWSVVVPLPPGDHEYKFVVDGSYVADPENPATHGDYGNSYISIGPDGDLKAVAATANTTYNPKLLMGGRGVATYQLTRNPEANRFELHTPSFDFGLKFDIRISDLMSAQLIMNTTNTNGYNSTLDLERGSIEFRGRRLTIQAFDNAAVDTWDDPLHLVGNIGIYGYRFGYNRQGFLFHSMPRGFESDVLYADNFVTGGTNTVGTPFFPRGLVVGSSAAGSYVLSGTSSLSVIGDETIQHGTFTQSGGTHTVSGIEWININWDATFTLSGGTHTIGTPSVNSELRVGGLNGGTGTYGLSGNGILLVNGSESIGYRSETIAFFNQTGGVQSVTGGVFWAGQARLRWARGRSTFPAGLLTRAV